jgi:hypothetical protein
VRRRKFARGRGRHHHCLATDVDRGGDLVRGALWFYERNVGDREETWIRSAEVRDCLVLRGRTGIEPAGLAAGEHRRGECREHELAVEAEQVERATPLRGVEGTHGHPALVLQQPLFGLGRLCRIRASLVRSPNGAIEHRLHRFHAAPPQLISILGIDEVVEEVGELHDVTISVENSPTRGVRGHCRSPHFSNETVSGDKLSPVRLHGAIDARKRACQRRLRRGRVGPVTPARSTCRCPRGASRSRG